MGDMRPANESAGIGDAELILRRIEEDERAAVEARERYRIDGVPTVEIDDIVRPLLETGEEVIDSRRAAVVRLHLDLDGDIDRTGRLYITTRRLLLVGRAPVSILLDQVEETSVAAERLLITMRDGSGAMIEVAQPRLLRVQIAAVLSARRV